MRPWAVHTRRHAGSRAHSERIPHGPGRQNTGGVEAVTRGPAVPAVATRPQQKERKGDHTYMQVQRARALNTPRAHVPHADSVLGVHERTAALRRQRPPRSVRSSNQSGRKQQGLLPLKAPYNLPSAQAYGSNKREHNTRISAVHHVHALGCGAGWLAKNAAAPRRQGGRQRERGGGQAVGCARACWRQHDTHTGAKNAGCAHEACCRSLQAATQRQRRCVAGHALWVRRRRCHAPYQVMHASVAAQVVQVVNLRKRPKARGPTQIV